MLCATKLLGSHTQCESLLFRSLRLSVVFRLPSVICLSHVRSRKLCKAGAKFRHPYKKSGSESKNMVRFYTGTTEYPKSSPKPQNSPKWGSRKLREICTKFSRLIRKLGLPSKNMTSDFAPEVAKLPKLAQTP